MITVYATETDYNQISTGTMEVTVEEWMQSNSISIDELVDIKGDELVFNVEWGNGEGFDEYRVKFA